MLDGGSDQDLRERLIDAVTGSLIRLGPGDFDDAEDRAEFERIMARFGRFAAPDDQGDVAASARLLAPSEAVDLAEAIRRLERRYPME
jgi:hypothetical protein